MAINNAKFSIGEVVKHRHFDFRELYMTWTLNLIILKNGISLFPEVRLRKDQPFYHLLAESNDVTYEAYVSEQNLLLDKSDEPIKHPMIEEIFTGKKVHVILSPQTKLFSSAIN